jgi:hypothetical protein
MSEINNDLNEAPEVEKTEEPVAEVKAEVVETPAEPVTEAVVEPVVEPVVEKKAKKESKAAPVAEGEKVALFSERNINWAGVGKLVAGYNLVSKTDADKWLSGKLKVRLATPEEIATKVAK